MLSLHAREPLLKLSGAFGICERAVTSSPSFATQNKIHKCFYSGSDSMVTKYHWNLELQHVLACKLSVSTCI